MLMKQLLLLMLSVTVAEGKRTLKDLALAIKCFGHVASSLSLAGTSLMTPIHKRAGASSLPCGRGGVGYWSPYPQSTVQCSKSQVQQETRTNLIYTVHEIKMSMTAQENFNFLILRSDRNFSRIPQ